MKKFLFFSLFLASTLKINILFAGVPIVSHKTGTNMSPANKTIVSKVKNVANSRSTTPDSAANSFFNTIRQPFTAAFWAPPTVSYTTPNYYSLNTPMTQLTPTSSGVSSIAYPATPNTLSATGLSSPWGVSADASGNLYVANRVSSSPAPGGTILKYTSSGTSPTTFISGLNNPCGIAFDPSSAYCYVAQTGGKVIKYPNTGGSTATSTLYSGAGASSVTGVTIDASGNVFFADYGLKNVYKYSNTGSLLLTIPSSSTLFDPSNVQVDAQGNIFILDAGTAGTANASIQKYSSTGTYIATIVPAVSISSTANPAYGFCLDKSGNFWVGNNGDNTIRMYSQNGTALYTISVSGVVTNPRGVYVDGTGTVYTTNYTTNAFYQFIPTGGYFIASGGALPAGLSLLSTSGTISGTPTIAGSGTYTVIAYNSSGSVTSNSFVINCSATAVAISYSPSSYYFATGAAISSITPTVTGSPTAYSVSPALPTGLTFNTSNGQITGTPTASSAATTYNISTTGGNNPSSTSISITVGAPPTVNYTTPNYYAVGSNITPLSPTSASVATGGYSTPTTLSGPLPSSPYGLGIDASNNIYVTNTTGNNVTEYTNAGAYIGVFVASVASPTAIVFDASGNAYVGTKTGGVYKYNSSGILQGTVTTTPASVYGLAIDASNNLYIADYTNAAVYKYTNATPGTLGLTISASANLTDPSGVGIDNSGSIYICDGGGGRVVKYTSTGTYVSNLVPSGQGIPSYGFYMDKSGNFYVGDSGNNNVRMFTQTGVLLNTLSTSTLTSARGIVADQSGNIFVSVYTKNLLYKYSPLGDYYISSGGPLLPGLVFNGLTGTISGTPTTNGTGTYTVTAYSSAGIAGTSNSFVITCNTSAVTIAYTPQNYYLATGTAIATISPTVTGSPTSYSISATLPTGLSFSTSTGQITGTPTAVSAATTYTVTATGAYNSNTAGITITVGNAPTITYTTPNNFPINAGIPTLNPTSVSVGTAGYSVPSSFNGPSPNSPYGMGIDASGNIYVANTTGNNVTEYNSAGVYIGAFIASVTSPVGITFDASGNAYVGTKTGSLLKYNSSGTLLGTIATTPASIYGLGLDLSGNVYVADYTTKAVYEYTSAVPGTLLMTIPASANLTDPSGVQIDASGNIFISDIGASSSKVEKYNSSGTFVSTIISGLGVPVYGFYVDKSGNIYVGDSGNNQVGIYAQNGTLITNITGATLTSPRGIVEDAYGDVYVGVYSKNLLYKYTPLGDYYLSSGGALPAGLFFNATTGGISGTPTAVTSGTYTVTAYSSAGIAGTSNSFVINCYISYDWIGTNSVFTNTANWESKIVPTATNPVYIGVNYPFSVNPIVGANTTIASLGFGNKGGVNSSIGVGAGSTLTVTGDITKQSDPTATTVYTTTILGGGTVTATNLNVLSNTTAAAAYTDGIISTISSLQLSGNVNLTSGFSTYAENASFSVTSGITSVAGLLQTTNAAGTEFSKVQVSNATLQLANAAALSSLSSNGTNTLSFNNTGVTIEYSGAAQTVYNDAAITGLPGGLSYQNIKFSGTGIKSISTGNLNVAGDFTNTLANNATNYVTLSTPTVNFTGTTQSLAGGAGNGSVFKNVTFSGAGTKTMTGGAFSVTSDGLLTMSGTNASTILNAGGFLTLNSDINGCATIPPINGPSITGNVNVQRYISGGQSYSRGYRVLSSPVYVSNVSPNNVYSVNGLINNCYVKGTAGVPGGFDAAGNDNIYLYRENIAPSNATFTSGNFNGINTLGTGANISYAMDGISGSFNIPVGNGYFFFFRGSRKVAAMATETVSTYVATPDTLTATGILNQGTVAVADWYTPSSPTLGYTTASANTTVRGFNLVGNPYASSINWDTFSATNSAAPIYGPSLSGAIYIYNAASKNYATYLSGTGGTNGGTAIIPSGQGFFVQALSASAALTFQENSKVNTQVTGTNLLLARRVDADQSLIGAQTTGDYHFRLKLLLDSVNNDEMLVKFTPNASSKYVATEDAKYEKGFGVVGLSGMSADGIALAINQMPFPTASFTLPLNAKISGTGLYTLNLTEANTIPPVYDIWLMDYYKKDSLEIKSNPTYTFDVSQTDTNSFGAHRFALVIRQVQAYAYRLVNFAGAKVQNGVQLNWTTANEGNYTAFTVQRSIDNGKTFSTIGSMNSTGATGYSLLDDRPIQGDNTYRLQQVGIAGDITYSQNVMINYGNTLVLNPGGANNNVTVYPNPATTNINVSVFEKSTSPSTQVAPAYLVTVTNSTGSVVKTESLTESAWNDSVANLLPGTYIINITDSKNKSFVAHTKFVKL